MHSEELIRAALNRRLPTVGDAAKFVYEGALAAYSFDGAEGDRKTAVYVDRILRGAKPRDLPVEQPNVIWFGLNLRTAHDLKIAVPDSMILRAVSVVR